MPALLWILSGLAACTPHGDANPWEKVDSDRPGETADTPTETGGTDTRTDTGSTDSGATDSGTPCDTPTAADPCACGSAWIADVGVFRSIQEAADASVDGTVVNLCPGTHRETVLVSDTMVAGVEDGLASLTFRGDSAETTTWSPAPSADPDAGYAQVLVASDIELGIEDVTIRGGNGVKSGCYEGGDFCLYTVSGGLLVMGGSAVLRGVILEGNGASFGGAFLLSDWSRDLTPSMTLIDSVVRKNEAEGYEEDVLGGGGAYLEGRYHLESINTDWGSASDDNRLDDVAIELPDWTIVSYADFGAGADFVCSSDTRSCVPSSR